MIEPRLDELNGVQRAVALHTDGPAMMAAVAGSGKTRAVIEHTINQLNLGGDPERFLLTTFSKSGAEEMNDRLRARGAKIRQAKGDGGVRVGTLHSVSLEIVRDGSPWCKYEVDGSDKMRWVLKEILGWRGMKWEGVDITKVEGFIAGWKNELIPVDKATHPDRRYVMAYRRYEDERELAGLLTFDDMTPCAVRYLLNDPDARLRWQGRFDVVVVDEFQDTNTAQMVLVKLLAEKAKSYLAVGDDDQTIFQFRGSRPEFMTGFDKEHPTAKVYRAEANYRSRPGILEVANKVIVHNDPDRVVKSNIAQRETNGKSVSFEMTADMDAEAETVAEYIKALKEDGFEWGDSFKKRTCKKCSNALGYASGGGNHGPRGKTESSSKEQVDRRGNGDDASDVRTRGKSWQHRDCGEIQSDFGCSETLGNGRTTQEIHVHEDSLGHEKSFETLQHPVAVNGSRSKNGMQQDEDRQRSQRNRSTSKEGRGSGRIALWKMERRQIQGVRGVHHGTSCEGSISCRTSNGDGTDDRATAQEERSGPSQERYSGRQSTRESGITPKQCTSHKKQSPAKQKKNTSRHSCPQRTLPCETNDTICDRKNYGCSQMDSVVQIERCGDISTSDFFICKECNQKVIRPVGSRWSDHVILFRTRAQSRAHEEVLLREKIPHIVIGGLSFYKRKEVADMLAYLKLAINPCDNVAFGRAVNKPFRYIGKRTLEKITELAGGQSELEVVREFAGHLGLQGRQVASLERFVELVDDVRERLYPTPYDVEPQELSMVLSHIVQASGYEKWIVSDEGTDTAENSRVSNLRELIRTANRFKTAEEMLAYIAEVEKAIKARDDKEVKAVRLMTIHKSKGLEFPVVYLVGAAQGILPHARAQNVQHERNLMYVAVTRARERLIVTCPGAAWVGSRLVALEPSQFVAEAGLLSEDRMAAGQVM